MTRTNGSRNRRRGIALAAAGALLAGGGTFATVLTVTTLDESAGSSALPQCQVPSGALDVQSDTAVYDAGSGVYDIPGVTVGNIDAACQNADLGLYLTAAAADGTALQSFGPERITSSSHHFTFDAGAATVTGLASWTVAIHPIGPEDLAIPSRDSYTPTLDAEVTATVVWTGTDGGSFANDMDIRTEGPTGAQTYYNNTTASDGGYLEHDEWGDDDGDGPYIENIYYGSANHPSGYTPAPEGEYKFYLDRYDWGPSYPFDPGTYTYTIRINGVIAWEESGYLTNWNQDPVEHSQVNRLLHTCTPDFVNNTCD